MALVAAARPSAATVAGDLPCTGGPTACILDTHNDIAVSPGSILDFGTRDLTVKRATGLRVGPSTGSMTILAKSVTLEPGASLFAPGGQILVTTTGDIRIAASGGNNARIDVSASLRGGSVSLTADGAVDIAGILNAKAAAGDGGSIDVTAGTRVDLSGEVTSTGRGASAAGGSISLKTSNGAIAINGPIDVSGTEGGGGDIDVEGSAGVATTVKLDASGGGAGGSGGSITILSSAGAIVMHAGLDGRGAPAGANDFGGTGAVVDIEAAQSIRIEGQLILNGGATDGEGGSVEVVTDGDLTFTAGILAQGNGVDGCGSIDGITLTARGDITLADIDVSGGTCGGGSVEATSGAKITLGTPFNILADGAGPLGFAGTVSLQAESVQIDGDISASSEEFIGGDVTIEACGDLSVTKTNTAEGSISAQGEAGTTALLARGLLRVAGRVFSGVPPLGSQGSNTIEYRSTPPNLTGSSILPPPSLTANLDPCDLCGNMNVDSGEQCDLGDRIDGDGCDSNCTFTRCGNGIVTVPEVCDDGNNAPCDGCSADCTHVDNVCGDTITECGEACDDGNTTSCDDCKGDCSRHDKTCGDTITECGEECDDGKNGTGDGCDDMCKLEPPPHCGDGTLQTAEGEQCDPPVAGHCSRLCQTEGCGNGIKDSAEACDDHNMVACDGCNADCTHTDNLCGDGHPDCGEICDDGNLVDGDGCDSNCTPTACGNGVKTDHEACDDGNTNACDGCAANCSRGDDVCGDGIVECSEDCDPPGPGCDDKCHQTTACTSDAVCGGLCAGRCVAGVCSTAARLNCNDNNPCTTDRCTNDTCQHTVAANGTPCDDGDACTTESCQSGQCMGTTMSCDDGDFCTDDPMCARATGCGQSTRRAGIAGVTCQLDAIDDALLRGTGLVNGAARAKISSAVRKARSLLSAANSAAGTPKARKKLQASKKALKALAKAVKTARKKQQLTEPLGGLVDGHVSGALGALSTAQI